MIGGARLTNEDAYAWAKLTKGVLATDNVDAQLGDGLPAEVVLFRSLHQPNEKLVELLLSARTAGTAASRPPPRRAARAKPPGGRTEHRPPAHADGRQQGADSPRAGGRC